MQIPGEDLVTLLVSTKSNSTRTEPALQSCIHVTGQATPLLRQRATVLGPKPFRIHGPRFLQLPRLAGWAESCLASLLGFP